MADIVLELDQSVTGADGRRYVARILGHRAGEGLWEGRIEFDPEDGSVVLHTERETEQHGREDLEYWAAGLTATYLEGAMERARHPRRNSAEATPPRLPSDP